MKDFWMNKNNAFIKNGFDFQFTPDDATYLIQKLQIKLRVFYGEYFLNTKEGVPYLPTPNIPGSVSVFGKNPNMDSIAAIFKTQINAEPLVDKITSFTMQFDSYAKQLAVSFVAQLVTGATVNTSILVP